VERPRRSGAGFEVLPATFAKASIPYRTGQIIYAQGTPADCLFHLRSGEVKRSVVSKGGKETIIALLRPGAFFGEGCMTGQPVRTATARAASPCSVVRIGSTKVAGLLHKNRRFTDYFISCLISHISEVEEDLVDQRFNSSEKRLARVLLRLANFGENGDNERIILPVSQQTLAEMIGTTRSRVNVFMNRFRKSGFIEYDGELCVYRSLLNATLHD
jgi:CRP/FNR family transcriptional regulator, cyclic AMP receptor protein